MRAKEQTTRTNYRKQGSKQNADIKGRVIYSGKEFGCESLRCCGSDDSQGVDTGKLRGFVRIVSPLCKPVYATVALFVAVGQWNSWFDAMLYNRMSDKYTTLQYELMKLLSSVTNQGTSAEAMKNAAGAVTPTSVRAAATILTMLPIVCLYPFLQKYFVQGLTLGSVKE